MSVKFEELCMMAENKGLQVGLSLVGADKKVSVVNEDKKIICSTSFRDWKQLDNAANGLLPTLRRFTGEK